MHAHHRTIQGYRLDLSQGSYAVPLPAVATQLTPARWIDVIRTGARGGTAGAEEAVTAAVLDADPVHGTELDADLVGTWYVPATRATAHPTAQRAMIARCARRAAPTSLPTPPVSFTVGRLPSTSLPERCE